MGARFTYPPSSNIFPILNRCSLSITVLFLLALSGSAPRPASAQAGGTIRTVAGTGEPRRPGDPVDNFVTATTAKLDRPKGVAMGARGGVFFIDGNLVRKYNPQTHILSTVAGSAEPGSGGDGGKATDARFFNPNDVATDAQGNVYVADSGNYRIRKVTFDGTVSTLAGTGIKGTGGDDGPAALAQFSDPMGLALDAQGNLYVTDGGRVRKIDAQTQVITTVAGTTQTALNPFFEAEDPENPPKPTEITFGNLSDVVADGQGGLYFLAFNFGQVFHVQGDTVEWIAGSAAGGEPNDAEGLHEANFAFPRGIELDANGDLSVTDSLHHRLRRLDPDDDTLRTEAGTGGYGPNDGGYNGEDLPPRQSQLNVPWGGAIDSQGNVYLADSGNRRLRAVYKAAGAGLYNGGAFPKNGAEYGETGAVPPPTNDDIQNAQELGGSSGQVTGTNLGATVQPLFLNDAGTEPFHGFAEPQHSVWYRWTPALEGRAAFSTAGSDFDTRMSAYSLDVTDPAATLQRVASNDDGPGEDLSGAVSFYAKASPTLAYYIAVDGYGGATGNIVLKWSVTPLFGATPRGPRITGLSPAFVGVGDAKVVRVTGENFFGSPAVTVNGALHPTRKIDDSTLEIDLTGHETGSPGALWLRAEVGTTLSNTYALDVYRYNTLAGAPGGTASGDTPPTAKPAPSVSVTVNCPIESGCTAAPAVGSLGEALNLGGLPGDPVDGLAFMTGVTDAESATVRVRPVVPIPDGSVVLAYIGDGPVPSPGPGLPVLGGGDVNATRSAQSQGASAAGEWRFVKGNDGLSPALAVEGNPDGTFTQAMQMTFGTTSVPRASQLSRTAFVLVKGLRYGDVNNDAAVDVQDAVMILKAVIGLETLSEVQTEVADVAPAPGSGPKEGRLFGDGAVDVQDAVQILLTVIGLE